MYKLVVVGTILASIQAQFHPVNEEIIEQIKQRADTWEPMEIEDNPLHHMTTEQALALLGTIFDDEESEFPEPILDESLTLPTDFDSRTQWGTCIHAIRNQAQCGSCWAFGASEVLSDRFCIKSNKTINVVLSPQDMVSCDKAEFGCGGGYLSKSFAYLTSTGIVTDACVPYTSGTGRVAACPTSCTGSGTWKKYKCKSYTTVNARTVATIQSDIYTNGPMETQFSVYQDFYNYKSGIYKHVSGSYLGGHAVKVIGWGVSSGVNYWICANSWGSYWGESGFFRIATGQCGIDSSAYSCTPLITAAEWE